jgi:phosphoribosylformimino-5-aminoimidazole carboxamide ribotide isomerase
MWSNSDAVPGDADRRSPKAFELLPAIDLQGGSVVRLVRGDFGAVTTYGDDGPGVANAFVAGGARWLHVVDLDGARDPRARQTGLVAAIVASVGDRAQVEVAGGLRDERAVAECLDAGAARVVLGTAAVRDPALAGRLVRDFGARRIAVALDVRAGQAVGQGWVAGTAGAPVEDALIRLADEGVVVFEVTAIDRDGTLAGPDLAMLRILLDRGRGELVASAGIATIADLTAVRTLGCVGAIVGRALYEGRFTLEDALAAAG